jgi:4-hydroxy-tetrahydrodipicolinate synthase
MQIATDSAMRRRLLSGEERIGGIVPVMLTPFSIHGGVDLEGLDSLIDWYISHGASGLFAVCQSSEMEFLTLAEKVSICQRVVGRVNGRVPVIASGHTSEEPRAQLDELLAVAATGVDAVVLVTNRLDPNQEGEGVFLGRMNWLIDRITEEVPLGFYECPSPFRRLLSDAELKVCLRSGRFVVLKDVSCDMKIISRRIALAAGTSLSIVNANAAIALEAINAGSRGFCGVFTNFHPDLYAWLYQSASEDTELKRELDSFLILSSLAENLGYPAIAKRFHQRLGTFASPRCRAITYDISERFWGLEPILDTIETTGRAFRRRIERLQKISRPPDSQKQAQ